MIKLKQILKEDYDGYYLRWKDWSDRPEYEKIYSEFEKIRNVLKQYQNNDVIFRGFNRKKPNQDLLYVSEENERPIKLGGHYFGTKLINLFWDMMKKKFPIESSVPIFGTYWYGGTKFFGNPMIVIPNGNFQIYQSDICKDLSTSLETTLRKKVGKETIETHEHGGISRQTVYMNDEDYKQISEELYQPLVDSFIPITNKNKKFETNDILIGNKTYWLLSVNWILNLPKWMIEKLNFTVNNMKYKDVFNIIDYTMKYMKWSKENYKSWIEKKQND